MFRSLFLFLFSSIFACSSAQVFPSLEQYQFLRTQPSADPSQSATAHSSYTQTYTKLPPPSQSYSEYQSPQQSQPEPQAVPSISNNIPPSAVDTPSYSTSLQKTPTRIDAEQTIADRIFSIANPSGEGGAPFDVDNLNSVINRVGRELHFLSDKSRECLIEKVRGLAQLKRMREGLKNTYKDIYNIQFALAAYQEQLKEMKEYLKKNRGQIVVVDNKQLGEMYSMVRRLQAAAESMVSGSVARSEISQFNSS